MPWQNAMAYHGRVGAFHSTGAVPHTTCGLRTPGPLDVLSSKAKEAERAAKELKRKISKMEARHRVAPCFLDTQEPTGRAFSRAQSASGKSEMVKHLSSLCPYFHKPGEG